MNTDPASLDRLNDIVTAGAVSWWPLAPGWYFIAAVLTVIGLWYAVRAWKRWRADGYRREALVQLELIRTSSDTESRAQLPILLKRVALSAWPRQQVSYLSGAEWHSFLDRSASFDQFENGAGEALERVAYGTLAGAGLNEIEWNELLAVSETWIRRHRAPAGGAQ